MTHRRITGRALRAAAVVPTFALVATSLAAVGAAGTTSAAPAPAPASPSAAVGGSSYLNTVAPQVERAFGTDTQVTKDKKVLARQATALEKAKKFDVKHAKGNPVAARGLAKVEAQSLRTGQSPQAIKRKFKQAPSMQQAKLLTILVEFNDQANDDFRSSMVPSEFGSDTCVAGNIQNGPKHNTIPNPASTRLLDNNSMWVKDFSSAHYNTMLYTKTGITQRVRTDLKGPDGKPGFDISGYTMKNMYEEMSKGAYTVDGAATPWITVPHSEAYYGATRCHQDENGDWTYDAIQDMQGHPSNPLGAGQLPIDAVAALAKAQPSFPWADYDIEDQGDVDGDGNFHEPDGVIDHVVLVHAGEDKSGGGGAEGTYAIWAHSSAVAGGAPVPGTNLKLSNYIVQPEDSGVGVFAHEYGHDLGLPDLYDTASGGDSDVDFWDLMSSGSHSGPIFQSMPTHMGIWDKWVLGWADPKVINPGDRRQSVLVGQASRTPRGTKDGLKINLPNKTITLATPHSGSKMWFSSGDQAWADNTLTRTVSVPAGSTDAKFWMWNNYSIEQDWDFGFVEVSTDGGSTWTEQKVYDAAGAEVSTSDTYPDPNGNLKTFGNKKYGLTGATDGWEHHYAKVTAYAGQDHPGPPALCHRRRFRGPRLVRRRPLPHQRRDRGVERRRRGQQRLDRQGRDLRGHLGHRLDPRHGHADQGAVLPGRVAQLRRVRQGPAVRLRHDLPGRRRLEGREDQVQRPRCPGLVPRHHVRQRQPRPQQPLGPAERGRQGWPAHRRQPLRPAAPHRRRGRARPEPAEEPAVATAVVQRRVQPRGDLPLQGVRDRRQQSPRWPATPTRSRPPCGPSRTTRAGTRASSTVPT